MRTRSPFPRFGKRRAGFASGAALFLQDITIIRLNASFVLLLLGRPTTNPHLYRLSLRIDERSKQILDRYCRQESVTKSEAIARGIGRLEDELKQN